MAQHQYRTNQSYYEGVQVGDSKPPGPRTIPKNKQYQERTKTRQVQRTPDGKIKCEHPMCSKTFSCLGNMKRHLPQHTGVFKFWCGICKKGFSTQKNMEDHQRRHEGKLHYCSFCSKSFQSRRGLDFHVTEHTGKYPFTCGWCGRGFSLRSKLEAHENEHQGKGFACMRCSKVFYTEKEFEKHQQRCY